MRYLLPALLLAASSPALAADLTRIDRTIAKEPKYVGKPNYCLLVFGPEAKHRVWLVQDGGTLYVDRNGDGDLTQPVDRVKGKKRDVSRDDCYEFEVGDLRVGGKTHKGLEVLLGPLDAIAGNPNLMAIPSVAATVRKDPRAMSGSITLDVECESLKGGGPGGRVSYMLSLWDDDGFFRWGRKPAEAPVVHLDGPLRITFYGTRPTWRAGTTDDAVLAVGTPGVGPGSFAMVKYEGTVPEGKHPKVEATFSPKVPAAKPVKELYELKERC
jgi:hypothetical protein